MAKFAIIAVDYENHVPRQGMVDGIKSLSNQTYKDFEVIICHDGPKEIPYEEEIDFNSLGLSPHIINTKKRNNDWGHSSRDMAMKYAYKNLPDCDYYIQFNIDNLFEPEAFEVINNRIVETESPIVIFSVRHYKAAGGAPFTGLPPKACHIDAMQLVAHKDAWKKTGFWYRTEGISDGYIYEKMCEENNWVHIPQVLGDNF